VLPADNTYHIETHSIISQCWHKDLSQPARATDAVAANLRAALTPSRMFLYGIPGFYRT
jgi:hypothetical protein